MSEGKLLQTKRLVCERYKTEWDKCKGPKDLINLAIDANGAEFLCDGIAYRKLPIDADYIAKNFADYINGNYVAHLKGYTSELYVNYNSPIVARTTQLVLINCVCQVYVPSTCDCHIVIADTTLMVSGKGHYDILAYLSGNYPSCTVYTENEDAEIKKVYESQIL